MKTRKSRHIVFAGIGLMAVGAPILAYQWKIGSERAGCLRNMRVMSIHIHSNAGVNGISPGDPFPGGALGLLKLSPEYPDLPKCPSGGTYSFGSDTTYFHDMTRDIRCSHAKDRDHIHTDREP